MSEKILKAEYRGEVVIGDSVMPCVVLEDGTRIISEGGIHTTFGTRGGQVSKIREKMEKEAGAPIPLFLASKALEPFISEAFKGAHPVPIKYLNNEKEFLGYPADILPKVCDVWLMARENKTLQPSQLPKAKKAEILMRGLAHIGITALVDEATGYQYERNKNELQKILSAYITDEVAKWQLTFTQDFYQEICRLWEQPQNLIIDSRKRPAFFGTLTNKFVYRPIQGGVVLDEIKQKSNDDDKKARLHQYLTQDIGREHLKRQIIEVTALMSICNTKEEFTEIFKKKYLKDYQQSLFADLPQDKVKSKGVQTSKELDNFVNKVMSHKIDPNAPLPNNSFKKS
ncbi:MAG: hypothetical protein H0A76_13235 [Candidatus Thiodubiliella endoseptemdiera]|uniref:Bacteriophage Mx8 p63 C-terminal domain-containing protein n=1 Tax=Candidatus Thiodubiliella endoseptemdiera TaxID=2738886 RepID=A0A853F5R2_9GAMM|nr:hypothetical protein [Candidatus Thiodubiliella endoseptemdiera]